VSLESKAKMANSQILKVEASVHINASAEQFHDLYCNRTHHIANILPQIVKSVEIHKGEWGTEGSIICWNYLHGMSILILNSKFYPQDSSRFPFTHTLSLLWFPSTLIRILGYFIECLGTIF